MERCITSVSCFFSYRVSGAGADPAARAATFNQAEESTLATVTNRMHKRMTHTHSNTNACGNHAGSRVSAHILLDPSLDPPESGALRSPTFCPCLLYPPPPALSLVCSFGLELTFFFFTLIFHNYSLPALICHFLLWAYSVALCISFFSYQSILSHSLSFNHSTTEDLPSIIQGLIHSFNPNQQVYTYYNNSINTSL